MLFLWYLSLLVSIVTLLVGIVRRSWVFLLFSTITFIPIASYFSGVNNTWKYVSLTPLILLILAILIWFIKRQNNEIDA